MDVNCDIAILGGGTAGLSAAVYAARAGFDVCVIEKNMVGGQIVNSPEVENYPALAKMSGFDFIDALQRQAKGFGAKILSGRLVSCDLSGAQKTITLARKTVTAKAVILAPGAVHRKLNVPGEDKFAGRGVSYCATCDGGFFAGKDVAVVGGGETAFEDALYLTGVCRHVTLIHRRDTFRAAQSAVDRLAAQKNAAILTNAVPMRIDGKGSVESLVVKTLDGERTLPVDGIFIAVGMQPENGMFSPWVELEESGYFAADESCTTKTPGVFVAGDARTKPLRQLVTAASDGAVAATAAVHYLRG